MDGSNTIIRVSLSPSPGFCIKSTTLQPAVCSVTGESAKHSDAAKGAISSSNAFPIPKGQKVFVNFAWDANVPPPPETSEEVIQKAMMGEQEIDDDELMAGSAWFIPVIVSEPRSDRDKGQCYLAGGSC